MIPRESFPRLTDSNHRITSQPDVAYNCIAWSAGNTDRWWEPGKYWPIDTPPDDYGIGVLEAAYKALGYEDCPDGTLEPGFDKVALYGDFSFYTHAARQLPNGKWTSKLGKAEDIEHDTPDDVAGPDYGEVVQFMRRRIRPPTST
jgi:hypothetical protein